MDIKIKLYEIVDNFLTEAKDQYGNDRSLDRLNQDRTLAVERLEELFQKGREETLRTVLPNISLGVSTSQYGFGYNDAIEEIKKKAKKLYNLDL